MTIYNFGAGPAVLPKEVLQQAQAELIDWHGSGMSVMEMSHRGKEFTGIQAEAEADLRELMGIPANYKVLFLQGGAHLQFAMIPFNLLRGKGKADYVITGEWSKKAIAEAQKFCNVNVAASNADRNGSYVPALDTWKLDKDAAYLHYTHERDDRRRRVQLGAGCRRGAAGGGHVVQYPVASAGYLQVWSDLCRRAEEHRSGRPGHRHRARRPARACRPAPADHAGLQDSCRQRLDVQHAANLCNLHRRAGVPWLKKNGGVAAMEKSNIAKAELLYRAIDASNGFYNCPVNRADRSRMNVPFTINSTGTLKDAGLDGEFLRQADARGLLQLKGHRSVGGMRASIYNAMPHAGVQALVDFMGEFARTKG